MGMVLVMFFCSNLSQFGQRYRSVSCPCMRKESAMSGSVSEVACSAVFFQHSILNQYTLNQQSKDLYYYQMQQSNCAFQEIINILLDIKINLQRGHSFSQGILLQKIDSCISKIAPLIDVYSSSKSNSSQMEQYRAKSSIINRTNIRLSLPQNSPEAQRLSNEQIKKVKDCFVRLSVKEQQPKQMLGGLLLDYFVVRYNFDFNEYSIKGRQGSGQGDRKVFVDLLTFQDKRYHQKHLKKSPSMTSVLKEIYSQPKQFSPLILPNCQQKTTKYLFVFELRECGVFQNQYYRTETFCCFVSQQFILDDLTQLMDEIARNCFQIRVSEAAATDEDRLADTLTTIYRKKMYPCIQTNIRQFISQRHQESMQKFHSQQRYKIHINKYLFRSEVRWSLVKLSNKKKQQKLFFTLVLLYYFAIYQYKIIILATNKHKSIISELTMGLIQSLSPLTYVYPIVAATITSHHFEFANSPVPIIVGLWGQQNEVERVKRKLTDTLKQQERMTKEQLVNEINFAIVDLQENSIIFSDQSYKQICSTCELIQSYIQFQTDDLLSSKLSALTKLLLSNSRASPWVSGLADKLKQTQMFDYHSNDY